MRITMGDKGLAEGIVETKLRWEEERSSIAADGCEEQIAGMVDELETKFRRRFHLPDLADILQTNQTGRTR